jgi:hypothetical protein
LLMRAGVKKGPPRANGDGFSKKSDAERLWKKEEGSRRLNTNKAATAGDGTVTRRAPYPLPNALSCAPLLNTTTCPPPNPL